MHDLFCDSSLRGVAAEAEDQLQVTRQGSSASMFIQEKANLRHC